MSGRILFVNRYAWPDHSATSQMLTDLALHFQRTGHKVSVITSRQCYDRADARLPARESLEGISIVRPWTTTWGRSTLPGRALDYASFHVSAAWVTLRLARRGDVVIVKTDPPLLSIAIGICARLRGARVVNWLQDLFPEVATALGLLKENSLGMPALRAARNRSLRRADMNVAIGTLMAERVRECGVAPARVVVIDNWTDDSAIVPLLVADNPVRRKWRLADRFVVGYSGNLGRAHDYRTLLEAADQLRADRSIAFLVIGDGHFMQALRTEVAARGLQDSFQFRPYQAREELARTLGVADVHWMTLRPELEGLIVPSKIYGMLASGRPVLHIGDPAGEIGRMVLEANCGFVVAPGDAAALVAAIQRLRSDPSLCATMSARAFELLQTRFTQQRAFAAWSALVRTLGAEDR